jgi:hypothetical protein
MQVLNIVLLKKKSLSNNKFSTNNELTPEIRNPKYKTDSCKISKKKSKLTSRPNEYMEKNFSK